MAQVTLGRDRGGAPGSGGGAVDPRTKERLGRIGLVGKGVVHAVLGILVLQLALGDPSGDPSTGGAVEWLADQPFGRFLLVALTASLFAMAIWQGINALTGDPVEGDEPADRAQFAAKAVGYLVVAIAALTATWSAWTAGDAAGGNGGSTEQEAASTVFDWPAGRWLVVAAGLAIIAVAVVAVKRHVLDQEYLRRLDGSRPHWVEPLGRLGYLARSIIYGIVGTFFVQAGLTHDPAEAQGMSAAVAELADGGWTRLLLWVVALGFLAYGAFSVAEARYRRAA